MYVGIDTSSKATKSTTRSRALAASMVPAMASRSEPTYSGVSGPAHQRHAVPSNSSPVPRASQRT